MWNAEDTEGVERPTGGGKMPTAKGRQDNAKPYARTSTSMFGRFCSSVKGLLKPSIITDTLSRFKNNPDTDLGDGIDIQRNEIASREKEKEDKRANPMDMDTHQAAKSSSTLSIDQSLTSAHLSQRPSLELIRTSSSAIKHSSHGGESRPYRIESRTALDDVVKYRTFSRLFEEDVNGSECSESSSSAGIRSVPDKNVPRLTSSETNVSTPIIQPDVESFLWSKERNDTKKQTIPSFDVSAFCQSIDRTHSDINKTIATKRSITSRADGESLFYSGQTQYGGSAAATLRAIRSELSSSPYQRRGAVQQRVTAKPGGTLGDTGVTSATSRRILEAMQRGEDSRASLRHLRSHDSIDSTAALRNASSTSVFHRNSAQYDATVDRDSLLANGFRTGHRETSDVIRASVSKADNTRQSRDTFKNPDFDQMISASELIRERPLESGRKMKKAPKHYSSRGDDDEAAEPNPVLCAIQPLPRINISPGLLGPSMSASTSSSGFSISTENVTIATQRFMSTVANEVTKPMSTSNEEFRISSETDITNTSKSDAAKSCPSTFKTTSTTIATTSLHNVIPPFGSKSVVDQSHLSSVTPSSVASASHPTSGDIKINSLQPASDSARIEEVIPSSNHDDTLSRPPLRDGKDVTNNSTTSSIILSSASDVVRNQEKTTVTNISSSSSMTSEKPHCASEESATVIPLNKLFKKPANIWTCDMCYITSKSDSTVCVSCESVRPGHVQSSLPTVVQDTTLLSNNSVSASVNPAGTSSTVSFGSLPKESVASEGQKIAAAFRFGPISTSSHPFSSSSIPSLSSSGGIVFGSAGDAEKQEISQPTASINSNAAPLFGMSTNNATVSPSLCGNSINSTPASSMTGNSITNAVSCNAVSSNTASIFGGVGVISSNATPLFGSIVSATSTNAVPVFSSASNVVNTTLTFGDKNTFGAPGTNVLSGIVPLFGSVSTTTTATSGMNSGSFSNNHVMASVSVSQPTSSSLPQMSISPPNTMSSSTFVFTSPSTGFTPAPTITTAINSSTTPMFGFSPSTATTKSSAAPMFGFTPTTTSIATSINSSATTMMGFTTTSTTAPPTAPIFGIPFSTPTNFAPKFGASTTAVIPKFGLATTFSVDAGVFSTSVPSTNLPLFGSSAPTSSAPMFGIPATTTPSNIFGLPLSSEKSFTFGTSTGAPSFGQQSHVPTFGQQVQQASTTVVPDCLGGPFLFGAATTTTNSTPLFQMTPVTTAPSVFGKPSSVTPMPSGFGGSIFPKPTFGDVKSDQFSAASPLGFGAVAPNNQFNSSNGMSSAVPNFGAAVGAKSIFGASSTNGQPGVIPTFGAVPPSNGPSFTFGNGIQNSQNAPNPFTFGARTGSDQSNGFGKTASSITGHGNKRGLDDGSNNGANPAKRSSDMFGNQIQNSNLFAFGSGQQQQQQAAPASVWPQQQPSAAANSNTTAFSTTLPTGFNFASASQFSFPAAPTNNNPGAVFQFGGTANQPSAPNPFNNAPSAAQNPFNVNAPNPFDIATPNPNRIIKKGVRKINKR